MRASPVTSHSFDDVFRECPATRPRQRVRTLRRVDVAVRVDRHTFTRRALVRPAIMGETWDVAHDPVLVQGSDAHPVHPVRGVSYWEDDESDDARIFIAVQDLRLIALNAHTGALYPDFGHGGFVDLSISLGREINPVRVTHTSTVISSKLPAVGKS